MRDEEIFFMDTDILLWILLFHEKVLLLWIRNEKEKKKKDCQMKEWQCDACRWKFSFHKRERKKKSPWRHAEYEVIKPGLYKYLAYSFKVKKTDRNSVISSNELRNENYAFRYYCIFATYSCHWSRSQCVWLLTMRSRVRLPVLPQF